MRKIQKISTFQFKVCLGDMEERLRQAAEQNNRSIAAELRARLLLTFEMEKRGLVLVKKLPVPILGDSHFGRSRC